ILDAKTGSRLRRLKCETGSVVSTCFSPDGKLLVVSTDKLDCHIWDTLTGEYRGSFRTDGAARPIAFDPSGAIVAAGTSNGIIRAWGVRSKHELAEFAGHTGPVVAILFSKDGSRLLSGGADGTVRV